MLFAVLELKGVNVNSEVVERIKRLYGVSVSIIRGKVCTKRQSLGLVFAWTPSSCT